MPSLVEIGSVVLEKKLFLFNFVNLFSLLRNYFGKGRGTSFEQTGIPFTQVCFVLSLVEIGPVVFEKKSNIGKIFRRTDRQTTDERRSEKLRSAKKEKDI